MSLFHIFPAAAAFFPPHTPKRQQQSGRHCNYWRVFVCFVVVVIFFSFLFSCKKLAVANGLALVNVNRQLKQRLIAVTIVKQHESLPGKTVLMAVTGPEVVIVERERGILSLVVVVVVVVVKQYQS
uniref:Uncharacterized protein n=1 Tax=Trypanosoma vivax (strain Y486) TaxID=1055687 RepID=G0U9K2_TRYVY|nr:hypothetical protein, unlikely [Trypanosoma vivax Y486]